MQRRLHELRRRTLQKSSDQWGRASSPRAAGRAQILHAAESGMCVTSYPYRLITGRVPQGLTIFRITQRHFAILRSRLNPNAA
jgi:hypothetical protein